MLAAALTSSACSSGERAVDASGTHCRQTFSLVEHPDGELPGSTEPEDAVRAIAEANGLREEGLTFALEQGADRASGRWSDAQDRVVLTAQAERLYDRGWYGTQLSGCQDAVDPGR